MKKLVSFGLQGTAALALGACCGNDAARFWAANDPRTGTTIYTVDTADDPIDPSKQWEFLDPNGNRVYAYGFQPRPITEQDYTAGTGGCTYSVYYCIRIGGCWAQPKPWR